MRIQYLLGTTQIPWPLTISLLCSDLQEGLHCRELRVQEYKVTLPRCLERKGKEAKSAETGLLSAFLNMLPHQGCVSKGPESPGHLQSEAPLCWSERILLK